MSPGQIACSSCRIRLPSGSPAIALFGGRCPVCGVALFETVSASEVIGFRCLDPAAFLGSEPDDRQDQPIDPPHVLSPRKAGPVRDADDTARWCDDGGGSARAEAVAPRPALS